MSHLLGLLELLKPTCRTIQDCVELLLPNAAMKLDLAYKIDTNVPACKFALLQV